MALAKPTIVCIGTIWPWWVVKVIVFSGFSVPTLAIATAITYLNIMRPLFIANPDQDSLNSLVLNFWRNLVNVEKSGSLTAGAS